MYLFARNYETHQYIWLDDYHYRLYIVQRKLEQGKQRDGDNFLYKYYLIKLEILGFIGNWNGNPCNNNYDIYLYQLQSINFSSSNHEIMATSVTTRYHVYLLLFIP